MQRAHHALTSEVAANKDTCTNYNAPMGYNIPIYEEV